MQAAIYARYSSDLQNARSIEDQISLCRAFAEREGLAVTATFEDRAQSGASVIGRDGIWQMMAAAQAGRFRVLIVEELDRLSRDMEDLANLHKRLTFIGVEIRSVHSGRADLVQVGIRGLLGQMFLQDLKHKVRRGLAGVIREGRSAGGKAYGYRPVIGAPGRLEIVEEEAETIRRIFAEYLAGSTARTICAGLNADGIPAPRGAAWNASTLNGNGKRAHGILTNTVYDGRLAWNRIHMIKDPDTGKRISRPNPRDDWQWVHDEALRIVDRETFAAVQALKAKSSNGQLRAYARNASLLSGLLKCAHCGAGMSSTGRDKPGRSPRIACSRALESGSCAARKKLPRDRVEAVVLQGLAAHLSDRRALALYVSVYNEERRRLAEDAVNQRGALEAKRAAADASLKRVVRLAVAGTLTEDEAAQQTAELRATISEIDRALANMESPAIVRLDSALVDGYLEAIGRLGQTLNAEHSTEARKQVRTMIERVTVDAETGEVDVAGQIRAITPGGGQTGSGGGI